MGYGDRGSGCATAGALVVSSPSVGGPADSAFGGGGRDRYGGGRVPLRPAGDYERVTAG